MERVRNKDVNDARESSHDPFPSDAIIHDPPTTPQITSQKRGEGIKETIESILIAFILAFVFRSFVVEAFVIPTGSMAPTLVGAHLHFKCPDCGYEWDENFSNDGHDEGDVPRDAAFVVGKTTYPTIYSVHCPNCGLRIPKSAGLDEDPDSQAQNPPVYYGDRILVLKYLYLLKNEPERWDVVVFKSPTDQVTTDFSVNFIKRLVGLPGEVIMILDGDVYTLDPQDVPNFQPGTPASPSQHWHVQRKPRIVQDALWRIVYDNDFAPQNLHRPGGDVFQNPWTNTPGDGWNTGPDSTHIARTFNFDSKGTGILNFDPTSLDPSDSTRPPTSSWYPLTDWTPYSETRQQMKLGNDYTGYNAYGEGEKVNFTTNRPTDLQHLPKWYVSDLKLTCSYQRQAGDGPLTLRLTKLGKPFTATIDRNTVTLQGDGQTIATPLQVGINTPARIDLLNVDYRASVRIDDKEVAAIEYKPNVADLLKFDPSVKNAEADAKPEVSISATSQTCSITHLSLWRDVYYTNWDGNSFAVWGMPKQPIKLSSKAAGGNDDEYFVLGDNSVLSYDARFWSEPTHLKENEDLEADSGRVPGRFLIGKAFFVYWPAGYRPVSDSWPGIVPNFGQMRLIH